MTDPGTDTTVETDLRGHMTGRTAFTRIPAPADIVTLGTIASPQARVVHGWVSQPRQSRDARPLARASTGDRMEPTAIVAHSSRSQALHLLVFEALPLTPGRPRAPPPRLRAVHEHDSDPVRLRCSAEGGTTVPVSRVIGLMAVYHIACRR